MKLRHNVKTLHSSEFTSSQGRTEIGIGVHSLLWGSEAGTEMYRGIFETILGKVVHGTKFKKEDTLSSLFQPFL
jgi:hypothetical protein